MVVQASLVSAGRITSGVGSAALMNRCRIRWPLDEEVLDREDDTGWLEMDGGDGKVQKDVRHFSTFSVTAIRAAGKKTVCSQLGWDGN